MSYQQIATIANASRETHLGKIPSLRNGQDEARAKELDFYIDEAESGLRAILKAGFFLECLAAELPHGQLGPWVEAHCKRKWRTVQRWQQIAAGVGEAVGIKHKKRIGLKLHEVLALPAANVPDEMRPIREKIEAEIAGKSYRQLFLELKQSKDGEKPDRGRRKGEGGASKEQRENAQARDERERLESMQARADEVAEWLLENAGAKGFARLDDVDGGLKTLRKLSDAVAYAHAFFEKLGCYK